MKEKEFNSDLILKEDRVFKGNLIVHGNIICEEGLWNIKAWDIKAWNIKAKDIEAGNINYWAVCYARSSFICNSIKGRRENHKHFCLDKEIEYIK